MNNTNLKLPFPPQEFSVTSGNKTMQFYCPKDADEVLNAISDEHYEKDQFLPYWVEHWPSAQVLFPFVMQSDFAENTRICELGCGLGIISAATASRSLYTLSVDISPEACIFAHTNIERNGGIPRVMSSDWRHMGVKIRFDQIIASDVLYEERWIEPILECINAIMTRDGKAWIADPRRKHWGNFKTAASKMGFIQEVIHSGSANEGKTTIEILELRRKP
jgi:predicted nicotinamide N-methyase